MTDEVDGLLEKLKTFALRRETFGSLVVTVSLQDCRDIIATIEQQRAEIERLKRVAWDRAEPMCPHCDMAIGSDDCDYESGTATCPECGESFTLEQASGADPC